MATKKGRKRKLRPAQHQARKPGRQEPMRPQPKSAARDPAELKLARRVAIVSGGDSGIGRAVAIAFAAEGADVAILYLDEAEDARETVRLVEATGRRCLSLAGDIGSEAFCRRAVAKTIRELGRLDIVVNNAGEHTPQETLEAIDAAQLERTFRTNVYGTFFLTRAALPHLGEGAAIINTASVTAYRGSPHLLDYSASKGAVISFTRSLALALAPRGIRVNAVAPGPIWTPLIPSAFPPEKVATFGSDTPLGRAGEPAEVAPAFVFLAGRDSSYVTGQVLHPNGGEIVNG